jgi:hypothetical protein
MSHTGQDHTARILTIGLRVQLSLSVFISRVFRIKSGVECIRSVCVCACVSA